MSRKPQNNPIRADFNRLESASMPWWSAAPDIASKCVSLAFLPLRMAIFAAEAVVAFAFASLVTAAALWWFGYIPDSTVAQVLSEVGDRLIGIIESSVIL